MKKDVKTILLEMEEAFYGIVGFDSLSIFLSTNERDQLDEMSSKYDCSPIGESWIEISEEDGFNLIKDGIAFDLVFTNYRNVDDEEAIKLTEEFLSHFLSERQFFTNVSDSPWHSSYASTPLTDWTFDCGIIVKDENSIGFICFMGED